MRSRLNPNLDLAQVQGPAQEILSTVLTRVNLGRKVTVTVLLQVVLFAASRVMSLFAACLELGGVSDQAIRNNLRKALPKNWKLLEKKLCQALLEPLPAKTRRRKRAIAIDLHDEPYHGEPQHAKDVVHRQSKSGTTDFFCYATVCLVEQGYRYTLGYAWVRQGQSMVDVLKRLVACVRDSDVPVRHLLMDRGFYSVAVMAYLQAEGIPFLMPVTFRGRAPKRGKKHTGLRALRQGNAGWSEHTHGSKGQSVTTKICVSYKSYRHHRTGRRHNKKLVFAAWRVKGTPATICEQYRKRFGIEASYRQLGHARIRTSTTDPLLRSFFVALSLLLRNLWVRLLWLYFGEQVDPAAKRKAKRLQLKRMLNALARICEQCLQSMLLNAKPSKSIT
jgi:hypothetical protein